MIGSSTSELKGPHWLLVHVHFASIKKLRMLASVLELLLSKSRPVGEPKLWCTRLNMHQYVVHVLRRSQQDGFDAVAQFVACAD